MPNLTISNLLQTHPSTDFIYAPYAFALVILFFLGSFVLEYVRKRFLQDSAWKKALKPVPSYLWWLALVALLMTWTRIEGIPYISMRILWLVLALFIVFIAYRVGKNYIDLKLKKDYFKDRIETQNTVKKYLPKKKKKK